uniref:Kinesin-associated protein 3 n=1 Tax=Elaeophora elaphi TaxID=1147741 RepID=A0A0R3RIP0_9BILA
MDDVDIFIGCSDSKTWKEVTCREMKNIEFDAHSYSPAVIVKYELESAAHNLADASVTSKSKHCKKIIHLKDLNERVDISALARHIFLVCPVIPDCRINELEQILYYLQKRHSSGSGSDVNLSTESLDVASTSRASMSNIEDYIEMLYDEISEKTKATALFLELSQNHRNLQQLIENEVLMGALVRVLRDDWKKSFELATNIITMLYNFSIYINFHQFLAHHKIGSLSMQIVDYGLKRWEAWKEEALHSDESTTRRLNLAIRKQQQLIAACLNLLLNLAEDIKVEMKMVNRRIVSLLSKCIQDRDAVLSLHLCATNFLLKLSIYSENKEAMINGRVVESISSLFPIKNGALRHSAIQLLFNLSFIPSLRDQMVSAGFISHIVPLIDDKTALKFLYQLSINDDAKAMITYTDALQNLMRMLLTDNNSDIVKAILINIALEKRNAQLLCGTDGEGLNLLIEAALNQKDQLLLKIVRNIAIHSGPTQAIFSKWAIPFLEIVVDKKGKKEFDLFALECLGVVNQLTSVDWASLAEQVSLIPWIEDNLKGQIMTQSHTDQLLQVVILCGTMARQLNAARLIVPLTDQLVELLTAQQEDDEMVIQVVYVFYAIITHEELSESIMGGSAHVGAYLIDLMHDKNVPIRAVCDRALSIIAERSEEWARKMDVERFRWHNLKWLEMVTDNNNVASSDSVISGSPDIYSEVFGAEDILVMVAIVIAWSDSNVRQACIGAVICGLCILFLIGSVSITRSLILTAAAWLAVFSFFSLISTVISLSVTHKPSVNYTYGFARAPVLAVFATTVLASLAAIFLIKESMEHILENDHHLHPNGLYIFGAVAASVSLEIAAYGVKNQPIQHVLTASSSSSLQEHFADISHAICYILPGLSVFLLPRLNALSLLALLTTVACVITHWFVLNLWWIDAVATLILSICIFLTMWPLSKYTGRILLQTTPPHVHNQLDRCISEASTIDGVLELRLAHFWQLDFTTMAGTVDVRVRRDADEQLVLALVTEKLSAVISVLTVQIVKDVVTSWQATTCKTHSVSYDVSLSPQFYTSLNHFEESSSHSHSHEQEHKHEHNNHDENHGQSH